MVRSIVAGARVRPRSQLRGLDAPGYDEDEFTLAVAALDRLPAGPAPETIHLVGVGADVEDWSFREALGTPTLQLHRHAAGATSLFAALAQAASTGGDAAEAVVAVERGSISGGAGAVALRLGGAPGLAVLGHRERGHPEWKRPDATEWTDAGRRALGDSANDGSGELFLSAPTAPPVLLQRWIQGMPRFPVVSAPEPDAGVGDSRTLRAALTLHAGARGLAPGGVALIAVLDPGRATSFLGTRLDAPVEWSGPWSGPPEPTAPESPPTENVDLGAVSEGAYVPRSTYLAELPSRWRFAADRCGKCGHVTFPVRRFCRSCGAVDHLERVEMPRRGLEVLAATTVAPGAQPTEFDPQVERHGAYDVVIAALAPEVRVTLQVTDGLPRTVKIGSRVDTQLRRIYAMEGEWRYGLKAVAARPP